ncbi:hypothetical protein K2O51_33525 (plasmid) [Cupriavidus pinatubonensis]|uniref:hypothetical protein n=1 Tax=Cupriavidus pinatubonensis TaxID=248026 RepID=UPI001C73181B|nr:hypothetical protein [Cupriavidus pinatubonensis]QYY33772.1 hypothetical protein K2O51_33525 [Cupriavidus pinatubonensis]
MKNLRPSFRNIDPETELNESYDLAAFALGFESRAIEFSSLPQIAQRKAVAFGFDHGQQLAYAGNKLRFEAIGATIIENLSDTEFELAFRKSLYSLSKDESRHIFVDISCFSRFRLASIVRSIFDAASDIKSPLTVDFAYSLASFEKPIADRRPNTVVGPAHPAFAGWSQGGYNSTAAVLGLGYEQDQALGVVEFLQAGEVWAFAPTSPIEAYRPEVDCANELLLSEIPKGHVLDYDITAPTSIIASLESVARGLNTMHSVVLVPFGPKIFVLCSLLVAALRSDMAVWRVSQGATIKPHDRRAGGVSVGLRASFN